MLRSLAFPLCCLLVLGALAQALQPILPSSPTTRQTAAATRQSPLFAATTGEGDYTKKKKGYVSKWVKKETLADQIGDVDFDQRGLAGSVAVVFKQGNSTKQTMALQGQLVRDVASQAGQFIKYGCGKGECGTCEALCDGKWIRPCVSYVPADLLPGQQYVIQVKETKAKTVSSGAFFSIKSFLLGFWNNLLGMIGLLLYRKAAKKNWQERQEYEDLIKQKTLEKKRLREQQLKNGGLSP